ncbi:hypothetical protein ABQE48_01575 [Mycolicibacterium thermoresistibile]
MNFTAAVHHSITEAEGRDIDGESSAGSAHEQQGESGDQTEHTGEAGVLGMMIAVARPSAYSARSQLPAPA